MIERIFHFNIKFHGHRAARSRFSPAPRLQVIFTSGKGGMAQQGIAEGRSECIREGKGRAFAIGDAADAPGSICSNLTDRLRRATLSASVPSGIGSMCLMTTDIETRYRDLSAKVSSFLTRAQETAAGHFVSIVCFRSRRKLFVSSSKGF